jgi:rare lipoprotein A
VVRALHPGAGNLLASKPSRREQRAARAAAAVPVAAPAPASVRPSEMDRLVGALPAASPATGGRPAATTQAADVEAGPVSVSPLPPAVTVAAAPTVPAAPVASRPAPVATPGTPLSQQVGSVLLQVASFASRDNATRALGQLSTAGIVGASISDIVSGGRTLWRLRVPAADHTSAAELAGRIVGLGFGSPQIVKE